ncbi:MAG TPA: hypothetical protein VH277_17020 [Gemmatimonadaceae bacterium]|jgi:hypothetical protein|nr:hypothetical protein [Gemmatimonadaceae bacterium]
MQHTRYFRAAALGLIGLLSVSCTSTTSPASRALDGEWTTPGHGCFTLGFTLDWRDDNVSGSGGYRTDAGPVGCVRPPGLQAFGAATVSATRPSTSTLSGTMTFDGGTRATFAGVLVDVNGGFSIAGTIVMPDGSAEAVTIYQGAVP